jgi:hypothetical protein
VRVQVPARRRNRADVAVTIILLFLTLIALGLFAVFGFVLDFLGADSPGDTSDALKLAFAVFLGSGAILLAGIAAGVVLMVRRRLAWWVGLATLVVVVTAAFVAIGHWNAVIG